ncbi:MAG: hypothetical protein RL497_1092 [Pseudomonadota bacterium]|jgi:hypothetical protein
MATQYFYRILWLMAGGLFMQASPSWAANAWAEKGQFQLDGVLSTTFIKLETQPFKQEFSSKPITGIGDITTELELRPNMALAFDPCTTDIKPRMRTTHLNGQAEQVEANNTQVYLNTALVQCRLTPALEVSAGRQRLQWGNSLFRSPSNPFFAESVLFNPVDELLGKDFITLEYRPNFNWQLSSIANPSESHLDKPANPQYEFIKTYGLKAEYTGETQHLGAIISQREHNPLRIGGFSHYTFNRALLLYGEFTASKDTSGRLPYSTQKYLNTDGNANATTETTIEFAAAPLIEDKIRHTFLLGGSYTLLNGWTANIEYLDSSEGFNAQQAQAWQNAGGYAIQQLNNLNNTQQNPTPQMLNAAPLLADAYDPLWRQLRQHYLIVQYSRTEYRNKFDVALQNISNLDDHSNSLALSVVYQSSDSTELFLVANMNTGGGERELGRLIENVVLLGLRFYTF